VVVNTTKFIFRFQYSLILGLATSVFCFKKKILILISLYPFERSKQALKEKERLLENIFDAIQDGIIVLDRNRNIVRVNRWMERKYASEMPFMGKKCYAVLQNRRDHCPECPYPQTLETGVPVQAPFTVSIPSEPHRLDRGFRVST